MVVRRVTQVIGEVEVDAYSPRVSQVVGEVDVNEYRAVMVSQVVGEVDIEAPREGYIAEPAAIIEISWDGETWTDETEYALLPDMVTYDYGLLGAGGSLAQLGEAPVAQMRCVLANAKPGQEGRYSSDRAGSQAQLSGGLFQKRIRFSAGYTSLYDPEIGTVFEGRIQDAPESERDGTVTVTCYGYDFDVQQQRPEVATLTEKRTDELIQALADEIGFAETELDRGYTVVPLFYSDGDDCLAKMREIAEAEGGVVWVDPQDATLKFWSWSHWVNKGYVATWTRANVEEVRPRHDNANAYDVVNVTYQPRRRGRLVNIHSLTKPIVVPPDSMVTERLRFRYPLVELYSYTTRARSSGGENLDAYLTVTPTAPQGAMHWEATFTNSHTRHALVVDKFDILGWPIEGLSNREYRSNRDSLTVQRRTDVRPEVRRAEVRARYAMQHLAQARLVAELKSWRLQDPPLVLVIGPVPGSALRHVGDVVMLSIGDGISQIDQRVLLLHRSGSFGGPEDSCRWEETWTAAALDDLYEYPDASTGTDDGAFVLGTSRLGYGRLGY